MEHIIINGLENEGPGDILGAIGNETEVDPDKVGEIKILKSQAVVEVPEDAIKFLEAQLDGVTIGNSNVSVRKMREDESRHRDQINYYVEKFRELVEMEREEEMRQHRESIRKLSGKERENEGKAILHLRSRDEGETLAGYLVKFMRNRKGEELPETEIGVGDLVMISKKDPLRDDNPTGTVVEKTNYSVTVAFDGKPKSFVFGKNLRMDLYVNDITYQRMKDALEKVRAADEDMLKLRKIMTGLENPQEPNPVDVDNWFNEDLNESQKNAVERALGDEDFHLIHGPPGTGKTTTCIEVIEQFIEREQSVLATADSNIAVDNILEFLLDQGVDAVRVGHPARVTPKLREHTLDNLVEEKEEYQESEKLREKAFSLKEKQDSLTHPSGRYRRGMSDEQIKSLAEKGRGSRGVSPDKIKEMAEWLKVQEEADRLFERSDELRDEAVDEVIEEADVVCTTNSTAGSELIEGKMFDVVVIDEATQATEPSCIIPITHGRKVVMAGDHKQLPPTVKSQEAASQGLEDTLFERLAEEHPEIKDLLTVQYRMHEKIMNFSNNEFYDGELVADDSVKTHTLSDLRFDINELGSDWQPVLNPTEPFVFLDTKLKGFSERTPPGSTSKENPGEAEKVKDIVENLRKSGLDDEDLAVISPYDDQVDLLNRMIDGEDLEIKTVDGFQGREKEVVIISLTRSNDSGQIGFLKDVRRLNVALTRAKRKLIVVGDSDTLTIHGTYQNFVRYSEKEGIRLIEF